jgi:hypothetical protein
VGLQVVRFGSVKKGNRMGGVDTSRGKEVSSTRLHFLARRRPTGDGEVHGGAKAGGGGAASLGSERSRMMGFTGWVGPNVPLGWTAVAKNKGQMGGLTRSDWAEMHSGCQSCFSNFGLREKRYKTKRFKYFQTEFELV